MAAPVAAAVLDSVAAVAQAGAVAVQADIPAGAVDVDHFVVLSL